MEKNAFRLFVPKQAVGASLVYFDLFNATNSGYKLLLTSCLPVVSGAVAVTGVVGVDLFLTRTSAVGTGGTAATYEGTDVAACTISPFNSQVSKIPSYITARLTPTGGATAGAVLSQASVFTEETNSGSYMGNLINMVDRFNDSSPVTIPSGTGIRIVQGSVASVGNIGFDLSFSLVSNGT